MWIKRGFNTKWLFFNLRSAFGAYTPLTNGIYKLLWEKSENRRRPLTVHKAVYLALGLTTLLEGCAVVICMTVLTPFIFLGNYAEGYFAEHAVTTRQPDPLLKKEINVE